jgi:hypothetical protein
MDGQSVTFYRDCKNCVKSKRRCNLVLPRCFQCTSKGLVCEYANPSGAPCSCNSHRKSQSRRCAGRKNKEIQSRYESLRRLTHGNSQTHDTVIIQYLISAMRDVPVKFAENMQTTFIHPQLHSSSFPGAIRDMLVICQWQQRSTVALSNILLSSQVQIHGTISSSKSCCNT